MKQASRNVVTFVTYMADGRMQLQQRSYVSPQGKPVRNPGLLSINGGLMESDNMEDELRREALEELGVRLTDQFIKIGDVYDHPENRINYVFRLTRGYDTLLAEQLERDLAIQAICSPEGLGRAFVWQEDLMAIIEAKGLTPISATILTEFPQLMPPPRPKL